MHWTGKSGVEGCHLLQPTVISYVNLTVVLYLYDYKVFFHVGCIIFNSIFSNFWNSVKYNVFSWWSSVYWLPLVAAVSLCNDNNISWISLIDTEMSKNLESVDFCEYCGLSLEFFSNINRCNNVKSLFRIVLCCRYLHYLRHYNDKKVEAGYHHLDKSRIPEIHESLKDLLVLEDMLHGYKGGWYQFFLEIYFPIF